MYINCMYGWHYKKGRHGFNMCFHRMIGLFCVIHMVQTKGGIRSANFLDEQKLITDLMDFYEPNALPVSSLSKYKGGIERTTIHIALHLTSLRGIDPKMQSFGMAGWISVWWKDDRLTWTPSEYGNITRIALSPSSIWLPTFVLDHGAGETMYEEDHYRWFKATAFNDGEVWWEPGGDFVSNCKIDVTYFPFDNQICRLKFTNWVYFGDQVNLTFYDESKLLDSYHESGEWNIVDTRVWRTDKSVNKGLSVEIPEIHYMFHLRRKPLYFIMHLVIPTLMLSCLVLLVFKLPPDSGEKIAMGVTLLLAFSVLILSISDHVPTTSDAVPLLVAYLIVFMGITCLTVGMSVYVLHLHHKNGKTRAPYLLRKAVKHISKIICHKTVNTFICENQVSLGVTTEAKNQSKVDLPNIENDINTNKENVHDNSDVLKTILRVLESNQHKKEKDEIGKVLIQEWKEIATVIDKFCFWIFLFLLIVIPTIMLLICPLSASANTHME